MGSYPYPEWNRLIGVPVEVRKDGRLLRAGVVEDAMPDSSAVWLAADGTGGRAMFSAAEGHELWISPRTLGGRMRFRMAAAQLSGGIGHGAPTLG